MSETKADPETISGARQDDAPAIPILIAPHRTLKARARPVTPADMDRVRDIVPRMFAAMYRAPGIGLAAPQVDISLRFAVIDLMPKDKPQPFTMINPEILQVSEEWATRMNSRYRISIAPVAAAFSDSSGPLLRTQSR